MNVLNYFYGVDFVEIVKNPDDKFLIYECPKLFLWCRFRRNR